MAPPESGTRTAWLASSRAHTGLAVCLALVALATGIRLLYGPHIRDDAYITLRYAANLASGQGFVYNPGEAVLGTSTPLYALVLAGLAMAGWEPTTAAVALGILSDAVGVFLVFQLAWQGNRWYPALAAALGYALYLPLVSHAVSGMETSLYAMLILATVLAYSRGRLLAVGALAAVVALLRPEGALLTLAIAGHHAWRRRAIRPGPVTLFALITLPWAAFSTLYFGSPLPNSVTAKLDLGIGDPLLSAKQLAWYFGADPERWLLPVSILAGLGLRRFWRAGPGQQALLIWTAGYALAFTAANKFVYPLWPFEWYFVPLLPPLALGAGYGLETLLSWVWERAWKLRLALAPLTFATLGAFYGMVAYHGYSTLLMYVAGREGLYQEIAGRLAHYGARDTVAAPEIGALGFYYPGPILDLHGLVSPQVVGLKYEDVIRRYRPPWLVSWDTLVPEELRADPWFDAEYRPVQVLTNWEGRRATLYRRYPTSPLGSSRNLHLGESLRLNGVLAERAGDVMKLRLDWDLLRPVARRYAFFVHLLDASGNQVAGQDNEPQEGTRPLDSLPPGHLVDLYDLPVPPGSDLAGAQVAIGAYLVGDPSQHLSWTSGSGSDLGWQVLLPLTPRSQEEARVSEGFRECRTEFGESVALLGYSLDRTPAGWRLSLFWQNLQSLSQDYTVFVHALDQQGWIIGQADGQPGEGRYPTSIWLPQEVVLDQREIGALPQEAAALRLGLYRLPQGQRLPVQGPGGGDSVTIDLALNKCQAPHS